MLSTWSVLTGSPVMVVNMPRIRLMRVRVSYLHAMEIGPLRCSIGNAGLPTGFFRVAPLVVLMFLFYHMSIYNVNSQFGKLVILAIDIIYITCYNEGRQAHERRIEQRRQNDESYQEHSGRATERHHHGVR